MTVAPPTHVQIMSRTSDVDMILEKCGERPDLIPAHPQSKYVKASTQQEGIMGKMTVGAVPVWELCVNLQDSDIED